jgi:hypothetical protein
LWEPFEGDSVNLTVRLKHIPAEFELHSDIRVLPKRYLEIYPNQPIVSSILIQLIGENFNSSAREPVFP